MSGGRQQGMVRLLIRTGANHKWPRTSSPPGKNKESRADLPDKSSQI